MKSAQILLGLVSILGLSVACRTQDSGARVRDEVADEEAVDTAEAAAGSFAYNCKFDAVDDAQFKSFKPPFLAFAVAFDRSVLSLVTDAGLSAQGTPGINGSFNMNKVDSLGFAAASSANRLGQVQLSVPMSGGSKTGTMHVRFRNPAADFAATAASYRCAFDAVASTGTPAVDVPTCDEPAAAGSLACTAKRPAQSFTLTFTGKAASTEPHLAAGDASFKAGFKSPSPRLAGGCRYAFRTADFLVVSPAAARGDGSVFFRFADFDSGGSDEYACRRR